MTDLAALILAAIEQTIHVAEFEDYCVCGGPLGHCPDILDRADAYGIEVAPELISALVGVAATARPSAPPHSTGGPALVTSDTATRTHAPHLTVFTLNQRTTRNETRDLYRMHLRIINVTHGVPEPDGGRILWALPTPDTLIIQAGTAVSPLGFPADYLADTPRSASMEPTLNSLRPGTRVAFTIVGNPTRSDRTARPASAGYGRGSARPVPPQQREQWLISRLPCLDVTALHGRPLGVRSGRQIRTGHLISTSWHHYAGTGIVLNPDALRATILSGIGRAKAWGCGLLMVAVA